MSEIPPPNVSYSRPEPPEAPRPPGVYFDSIPRALQYFAQDWLTWVAAALLSAAVYWGLQVPTWLAACQVLFGSMGASEKLLDALIDSNAIAVHMIFSALQLIPVVMGVGMVSGMMCMAKRQILGEPFTLATIWEGFREPMGLIAAAIMTEAVVELGLELYVLPGIFLAAQLVFAPYLPALEGARGWDAMRRSWNAVRGRTFPMACLLVVTGLIVLGGSLFCCVGLVATLPVGILILAQHYVYFFNPASEPSSP